MHIDLRTVSIKPLRHTFDHVAKRIGGDKPASRYQEATFDVQATYNFHYRPTWAPQYEIFDPKRTAVVMRDWYDLRDPRQFYYSTYVSARAKQQEAAQSGFTFVESKGLLHYLSDEVKQTALDVLLPLRHVAWGGNMNNAFICAYSYGTTFSSPHIYHAMDHLGIAQYITRIGLLLDEPECLDAAKTQWLQDASWQELRRYVEDSFVVQDWFELFVLQNLVLDGLLYPLVYAQIIDGELTAKGGSTVAMLTQFMSDWFDETGKWVDAQIKTVVAESAENKTLVQNWLNHWAARAKTALLPVAQIALGDHAGEVLNDVCQHFSARVQKLGLADCWNSTNTATAGGV